MARAANKLTALGIKKEGLYLQVSNEKTKAWVFRFMINGRARKMGLGAASLKPDDKKITLADAREMAADAHKLVVQGIDPIAERDARKAALAVETVKQMTFGQVAEEYIAAHQSSWKNAKHRNQWRMTLLGITPKDEPAEHDYCKAIRNLPVNLIDDALVLKVLRPIWEKKTTTASRLRGRIETVLDYAKVALRLRNGDNPARWEGNLEYSLPNTSKVATVGNHPALPYDQMAAFMTELRRFKGRAARALEFTILCAARSGETLGARRSEIDWDKKLWTVPKARMKGEKGKRKDDHIVPLSAPALAILKDLPEGEHLFPLGEGSMAAVIDRINEDRAQAGLPKWIDPKQDGREIVVHGFRSSFKDWASEEEITHDNNLSEMALSHTLPNKVELAYRRGTMLEKRRRLMVDWAGYCYGKSVGGDNVVAIGGRK